MYGKKDNNPTGAQDSGKIERIEDSKERII